MFTTRDIATLHADTVTAAAAKAARAIPPLWPLTTSVAVNPFLGQAGEGLAEASARLARVAGARLTMPRTWYAERIASGEIAEEDLLQALAAAPAELRPPSLAALKAAAKTPAPHTRAVPSVADLAAEASGTDWPGLIAERFGAWAAGHFDAGQALWPAPRGRSAYAAWRAFAIRDLTPEIIGLKGFAQRVAETPESPRRTIGEAVARLGLPEAALETYFHRLLASLGGWAQYARYLLWQAELGGKSDATLAELIAIRIQWEAALFDLYGEEIRLKWAAARRLYGEKIAPSPDLVVDAILQEAAERAHQRRLAATLSEPVAAPTETRPTLQVAFCIDVRSEVFRRCLESLDGGIRTLGFAGFFGLGLSHRGFASDVAERRLPVLLNPTLESRSGGAEAASADLAARLAARASRAWGRFKLAAVSSFAFVEASGPVYVGRLLRDGLGLKKIAAPAEPAPRLDPPPDLAQRIEAAETVLKAMSLTEGFAPLVLLAGHGARVTNNPHASALQCGACGGFSGEANARLLAALLNDEDVRAGLKKRGIAIADDTLFLGALHDTTSDAVTVYADDHPHASHTEILGKAQRWLAAAGKLARAERAARLPRASSEAALPRRGRDWAETRPEWGLAGCSAFIAAPRGHTQGREFQGRAFLHDYDWRQDEDFSVLELIMTAPVVVASWISLQYYGSSVAPEAFGSGNKVLHNVVGGIGVTEGNGGNLRAGLAWQSVHDGERLIHEPLRLSVVIAAPREAMTAILRRHEELRALFEHGWMHLFALDEEGRMTWRYAGGLQWTAMAEEAAAAPRMKAAG
ncbi:YbcC family protein [Afifella pfennigii]|uniref:YbcC family protein n=1 Tax=Afifella pfennigii TaxID=209897 RepID=UPI00055204DA|nr:DUF2309 domain-containing protein [Afifella pfennigii]